jgi:hypothetical protein
MINQALDCVRHGEKAFVVFTRGHHFQHDESGKGATGNWVAGQENLDTIDKVIIYMRNESSEKNQVFIGIYDGWINSTENNRKVIKFYKLEELENTNSNWIEFGGTSWSPTFYIER